MSELASRELIVRYPHLKTVLGWFSEHVEGRMSEFQDDYVDQFRAYSVDRDPRVRTRLGILATAQILILEVANATLGSPNRVSAECAMNGLVNQTRETYTEEGEMSYDQLDAAANFFAAVRYVDPQREKLLSRGITSLVKAALPQPQS